MALCLVICTVVDFGFIYFLKLGFLLTLLKFCGRTFGYLATFSTRHLHAAPVVLRRARLASVSRAAPAVPRHLYRPGRTGMPRQPLLLWRRCTLYSMRNSKIRNGMKCQTNKGRNWHNNSGEYFSANLLLPGHQRTSD
jgi:hypothetical protein